MKNKQEVTIDMCEGPIFGNVLKFAVPIAIGNFMQVLFQTVDMAVVGKFAGNDALAAVGANISLINLILNLFIGLAAGTNIIVARYYGAGKRRDIEDAVHTSMAICAVCGIGLMLFGIFAAEPALRMLETPEDILDKAVLYLQVYACGFPFILIFNFTRAIINAEGDTKWPLYCLLAAGGLNMILDLIFVLLFHMNVGGVAMATVFANGVSAGMMLISLCRRKTPIKLRVKRIKFNKDKGVEILKIGLPAGLQGIAFSISHVIVQEAVNSFGSVIVAANTAVINLEGFLYHAMYGFYQASGTFISRNYGARNYGRIPRILKVCLLSAFAAGFSLTCLCIFFRTEVMSLYSNEADVITAAGIRILVVFPLYFLCGANDVMAGAMRGIGHSTVPLAVSLSGACVLRILWLVTVFKAVSTLEVLYLSYPISWALTFIANLICFRILYRKLLRHAR